MPSAGETTMIKYQRPFSHIEVVDAFGAIMSCRCFWDSKVGPFGGTSIGPR
jgi:hypothetical protein